MIRTDLIVDDIVLERRRQDEKFPDQHLPNGTGGEDSLWFADTYRSICDSNANTGILTWADILREEAHEALAEADDAKLRAELVQVAAVAVRWIEDIDGRAQ